jgi:hypothetical protein
VCQDFQNQNEEPNQISSFVSSVNQVIKFEF